MDSSFDPESGPCVTDFVQSEIERLALNDIVAAQFVPAGNLVRLQFLSTDEAFDYPVGSRLITQIRKHLEGFARHRRLASASDV